ncbi:hypothetical protein [Bacillus sp. FJAT-29937]|nr:hypothetical protein [Bacillus sp. FJAT-29937]
MTLFLPLFKYAIVEQNRIEGDTTAVCFLASPLIWNVVGLIQNLEHEWM